MKSIPPDLAIKIASAIFDKFSKDLLPGGKGDDKPDSAFDKGELAEGSKHEKEHTKSKALSKEIAKDHLTEDPKYYDKLEKVEKKANTAGSYYAKQGPQMLAAAPAATPQPPAGGNLGASKVPAAGKALAKIKTPTIKKADIAGAAITRGSHIPQVTAHGKKTKSLAEVSGFAGGHGSQSTAHVMKPLKIATVPATTTLSKMVEGKKPAAPKNLHILNKTKV